MKYLITGATGNIGSLVTTRLLQRGEEPCVLVRDRRKARKVYGDRVEIRVGDLTWPAEQLATVFEGSEALFLINTGPDLAQRDANCALAARKAGIEHLVKLSTLDVTTGIGTGPWHARGEAAIRRSGVPHTFIQAAAFMSNALSWADSIRTDGALFSSTGDGKIAFIHPGDIADVAVSALTRKRAQETPLVITGREALSYRDMVTAIGAAISKPVGYKALSDAQALAGALMWADRAYAEALVDIWRAVREGRLATVSAGVEQQLGRPPRSFVDWIGENIGAFGGKATRS
ncbi:NAD(P)H-binding protein [Mesorhizobium sp. B2-3-4]|uniref:NAD(P)H-binding protein n=1 Tax=Mesorhizobium sp. B2-3-4 TaxID=2589959 RepID=UPI00112BD6D4|nr:NAD(P)H-binding protein [Mesorhizobium sp. B2-3-4]TPM32780.1 NAD-dependent epimerase/dehydratase family protein [Mesorhizobium sp. B2-3-4]